MTSTPATLNGAVSRLQRRNPYSLVASTGSIFSSAPFLSSVIT
jgi:hypothetical protein